MFLGPRHRPPLLQVLLRLGRVSVLPTVWSNCVAGWVLGGGGDVWGFLVLLAGATCLFLGGAFLNDAFDADLDRLHRQGRPIPAGWIGSDAVWRWGFAWLGTGTVLLVLLGNATGACAALLLFCIVLYDAVHKLVASSPLLMAFCRLFLYLAAASVGANGVQGLALWNALALAVYVTGLGYLARHERSRSALPRWPALLLFAPVLTALLSNAGDHLLVGWLLAFLVTLWILRALQPALMTRDLNVRRSVEALLAGMVLVDLLALGGDVGLGLGLGLAGLFGLTLLLQRWVPSE